LSPAIHLLSIVIVSVAPAAAVVAQQAGLDAVGEVEAPIWLLVQA
jgi:hypothetical protein